MIARPTLVTLVPETRNANARQIETASTHEAVWRADGAGKLGKAITSSISSKRSLVPSGLRLCLRRRRHTILSALEQCRGAEDTLIC